jgi:ABC-type sugar transport system substrate-binding protein
MGIAGVVVGTSNAAAGVCRGVPTADAAAIARAPVVFVGTVMFTTDGDRTAYVTIDEVWRGPDLAWLTVVQAPFGPNSISSVDRT